MQGFYSALPQLDSKVNSTEFSLFTESYGGHYGPAFFNYFYDQNAAIQNGTAKGKAFTFNSLGIINGIISEKIQAPYYPEFAVNNTYGIKAVNDTVYSYMKVRSPEYSNRPPTNPDPDSSLAICRMDASIRSSFATQLTIPPSMARLSALRQQACAVTTWRGHITFLEIVAPMTVSHTLLMGYVALQIG
jgi:carboxypeptidase C (cathepsin A)